MADTPTLKTDPDDRHRTKPLTLDEQPVEAQAQTGRSWYNPRGWSLRTKIIAAIIALAGIVGIIVGAVEGSKAGRYPEYSPLDYRLVDSYSGLSFFDQFRYFDDEDPTDGFVNYVNKTTAQQLNLTYASPTSAILRVDTATRNASHGRNSVRIESFKTYDDGLFIFDIIHTPYGCGTWPALWLTDGYNWPDHGEIDVLEATNNATDGNAVTLHTTPGCNMDVRRKQTGSTTYATCDNNTNSNAGCGVQGPSLTYGEAMNERGGGIYALELRPAGIRAWFFPRHSVPLDIDISNSSSKPDPSKWGTALADFPNTSCDVSSHFKNQSIIANIDLCGQWGGAPNVYSRQWDCPGKCKELVARHPERFEKAYWEFGGFWVYQAGN
ncbi:glycoside hydrolase family 16 protein [Aspergillus nidulans FGSC A4]|uniref:endo-1,3(4)-beta-glucanase n=1 Tax=Emericella nidulans (strain FGSC A4 / ATCC 38163 / CBS 112.46 / NRRL 194 / M139) TaxID=227321 RepID=C8V6C5_EMENI|nr:hypothetical protein [Aspergillus nidulans FGSC A4]CBF75173.1 TPA: endo-1,3(4)-beta-glucanase, putative (AFU_orthologue; AFUA_5G02280) [Aspergillus nidulans FGSC A4]